MCRKLIFLFSFILLVELVLTSAAKAADPNLVSWWKFDESDANVAHDSSGHGYTATFTGVTWAPTSGKLNGALSFDGTENCYVEIPTTSMNVSAGTVALWARLSEARAEPEEYFFGHTMDPNVDYWSNRIQLYMNDGDTQLDVGLGDEHSKCTNIKTLSTNTWYHIALTWDGANYAVYIDATRKADGTYTGLNSMQPKAHIGNAGKTTSGRMNRAFNGLIDDVRIYNYALDANDVNDIYQEGL